VSVARSAAGQTAGSKQAPARRKDELPQLDPALEEALEEIARIEGELRASGDLAALGRFGDPDAGLSTAAALGHGLLATWEARKVDQLSAMPDGARLVRAYLRAYEVPRQRDVDRLSG
jgi:hypothetical protein